ALSSTLAQITQFSALKPNLAAKRDLSDASDRKVTSAEWVLTVRQEAFRLLPQSGPLERYAPDLTVTAELVRGPERHVVWRSTCSQDPHNSSPSPGASESWEWEKLSADGGAELARIVDRLTDACIAKITKELPSPG